MDSKDMGQQMEAVEISGAERLDHRRGWNKKTVKN